MGFLDSLGTVLDRVVPTAISFVAGGPAAAVQTAAGVERAKRTKKQMERAERMAVQNFGTPLDSFAGAPSIGQTSSPGFFAPGGSLRTGIRDFGGFLSDFAPVASVFGLGNRFQDIPASGATTIINQQPQETAMSGEIAGANLGLALPAVQGIGRALSRSPGAQALFGGGAGIAGGLLMGGDERAPRITRKMKSDVRKIYMMAGMDPNATAQILNNLGTYPRINFNANTVFFILTKRFRNDGPVVTKAAVRKTKTTLRRMKGVVDMYNSVCKPTTRRAPARRAAPKAVQLIKN